MKEILALLERDSRYSAAQIANMLGREEADVRAAIAEMEKNGTILGYKTIVDWDRTEREYVSAIIEIKITPQKERGFDRIAERIYNYPEVQSVYLISGSYDLTVTIEGRTMREVAFFVSGKLAPIEGVISTATHFVLRKYKDRGVIFEIPKQDDRENCN